MAQVGDVVGVSGVLLWVFVGFFFRDGFCVTICYGVYRLKVVFQRPGVWNICM